MVDWKFYIDSPLARALDDCYGSLTEGDNWNPAGYGHGDGDGWGDGYGIFGGGGRGCGYGFDDWAGNCNGGSSTKW